MADNIRRASFKIVIRKVERPFSSDPFEELDWICQSFGFFERTYTTGSSGSNESQESTPALIFKEILRLSKNPKALTSSALANRLGMSRGALLNHLNNLQRSGLVVKQGRYYLPRSQSIQRTIEEIEEDIERIFQKMKKTAHEIDREFGVQSEDVVEND